MSYKTGRGNVAKKCLRFHAPVKMVFDYQSVTKYAVAVSRRCKRPDEGVAASLLGRPLKKKLELKARENRVFEHDSTFFTFRLNNRFSESCFYR